MLDQREVGQPLVVELIPLNAEGTLQSAAASQGPSKRPPPTTSLDPSRARRVVATQSVAFAGVAAVSRTSASVPAEAVGASAVASGAELEAYQRRLYEIVARNSRYPADAKRLRLSGVTHLAFRLDRLGEILDTWVQESSGSEVLDDAALDALKRSEPLPPIPSSLPSRMDFVIEIDSSLLQQRALSMGG